MTLELEFEDGSKAIMEQKEKWELEDSTTDKKCILYFINNDKYTGIYKGLDGSEIMLESLSSKHLIGLPYVKLSHFLLEVSPEEDSTN